MKRLRFIGRRISNGIGLVLTVAGILAAIGIVFIVTAAIVQAISGLWDYAYSAVELILLRIGVPEGWTNLTMILLALALMLFVVGALSTDDDEVEVRGVEPGVQKDEEMNEPDAPYRLSR